jgi:hypothetical protein
LIHSRPFIVSLLRGVANGFHCWEPFDLLYFIDFSLQRYFASPSQQFSYHSYGFLVECSVIWRDFEITKN